MIYEANSHETIFSLDRGTLKQLPLAQRTELNADDWCRCWCAYCTSRRAILDGRCQCECVVPPLHSFKCRQSGGRISGLNRADASTSLTRVDLFTQSKCRAQTDSQWPALAAAFWCSFSSHPSSYYPVCTSSLDTEVFLATWSWNLVHSFGGCEHSLDGGGHEVLTSFI